MTLRPVQYLDPTKPQLWTRWLVDWIPPTTTERNVKDVRDWLVEKYGRRIDSEHSFAITHADVREVEFGGGPEGKYRDGEGIRLIAEYVARGANRNDVHKRVLRATEGSWNPETFSLVELARVNLGYPVLALPTGDRFKAMTDLVRTY